MPTITTVDATWDTAVTMDDSELRRADTTMFLGDGTANGVRGGIAYHGPSSLAVTVNGSDQVTVQAGAFVIPAATGLGAYRGSLAAATSAVDISARNATNPRIDLIVATANGTNIQIKTVDGTPGASPSAPALPALSIELARITVPQVGGGAVTVDSTWRTFATALGGILYVPTAARLPISGTQKSQRAIVLDTGIEHAYDGVNWRAQAKAAGLTVTNGPSTNAAGTLVFPRSNNGVAVVNVNLTATAALTAGAVLFVLDAAHRPPVEIFATLTDTTGDVPVRVGVNATTGECLSSAASIPSGRIVRGSIPIPL